MKKCITTIYYLVDNFCKIYNEWEKEKLKENFNELLKHERKVMGYKLF